MAGEAKNVHKTMPRAVMGTVLGEAQSFYLSALTHVTDACRRDGDLRAGLDFAGGHGGVPDHPRRLGLRLRFPRHRLRMGPANHLSR